MMSGNITHRRKLITAWYVAAVDRTSVRTLSPVNTADISLVSYLFKLCSTFVMLLYAGPSHGVRDPLSRRVAERLCACVRIPPFFPPFRVCAFACDISQHV